MTRFRLGRMTFYLSRSAEHRIGDVWRWRFGKCLRQGWKMFTSAARQSHYSRNSLLPASIFSTFYLFRSIPILTAAYSLLSTPKSRSFSVSFHASSAGTDTAPATCSLRTRKRFRHWVAADTFQHLFIQIRCLFLLLVLLTPMYASICANGRIHWDGRDECDAQILTRAL